MRKKRRWDEEFCKMCEKKGVLGKKLGCFAVAPYAGAWIEIVTVWTVGTFLRVAPYAGAWIEIETYKNNINRFPVAPYAGAWIEITIILCMFAIMPSSLPTRERGLKSRYYIVFHSPPGRSLRGSVD